MNPVRERQVVRWVHLVLSVPIVGYIYGPVASIPPAERFVRWIAVPAVVATGLWLWLKPRIRRWFEGRRRPPVFPRLTPPPDRAFLPAPGPTPPDFGFTPKLGGVDAKA